MSAVNEIYRFPATFGQEQLWYLNELAPESTAYNIAFAFEIRGKLDSDALERAWVALIEAHDALRTGFRLEDDGLRQLVHARVPFALERIDLAVLDGDARLQRLNVLRHDCARRHFDLTAAPLVHACLVRLAEFEHVLLACVHHIVVDHLSVLMLGRELGEHYGRCIRGEVAAAGERLQFPDYAVWQREHLTDAAVAERLAFWIAELGGRNHNLGLATDRPRPKAQTFRGQELEVGLSPETSAAFRAYVQRTRQSPFMVLLAALAVVLQRYSTHRDVIVGCPMANRSGAELEDVIGLFMNVVPIAIDVESDQTFAALVAQVRGRVVRAQGRQDTPFERIVQAVSVGRDPTANPLVQVWFTFQDAPLRLELPGLEVRTEPLHNGGAKLDLSLWYWDDGQSVRGLIEYNTDLFVQESVQRFAGHIEAVICAAVADDSLRTREIDLLTGAEREVADAAHARLKRDDTESCLHGAFFEFAAAQPEHIALTSSTGDVTAGDLARWADAIAAALIDAGACPGDIVGVCIERGASLVAGLLGVLRCGAAYLPLDPVLPTERIAFMVGDAGVRHVLVGADSGSVVPAGVATVPIANRAQPAPARFVPHPTLPGDLAYVMYTSGSTGRPKGVLIEHGSAGNFLSAMRERPGIRPNDVVVAVTTYAFDISILELFLPLSCGARVWIADRATVEDGHALRELIDRAGATLVQATPSGWRSLRAAAWPGRPGLRALAGGEALTPDLAQWLVVRVGELWNLYGPTETTVWSSCARIMAPEESGCPIGTPIINTTIHVVDECVRPQPSGVPGEIVIGGRGLARGYIGRDALTAERFVALGGSGERVYRTGDRGVRRADGQLEHLGRLDGQIKVRGYRIEPGEIEATMAALPGVDAVAVRDWRLAEDDHRLIAYLTTIGGRPIDTALLREHARRFLPAYMVPHRFVQLDELPLTPNGKVDRLRLPPPTMDVGPVAAVAASELSSSELLVLDLCRDLLGSATLTIDDNFFEAGGHSLLALTLMTRLERATGRRLSLLRIATSSLRALAKDLRTTELSGAKVSGLRKRFTNWVTSALGGGNSPV